MVRQVGEGVTELAEGDAVETAAAVMLQGMTAHYLCESTFPARAGQTALVHAAAGGVGRSSLAPRSLHAHP